MVDPRTCPSQRIVEGERLQCVKPSGHRSGWHLAFMSDETSVQWEGASSLSLIMEAVGADNR